MAVTAMATSFKGELMQALHNFTVSTGNVFKMALIKVSPSLTYAGTQTNAGTPGTGTPTTANLGTDEVSGTGYTAGGLAMTNVTPVIVSGTAVATFSPNPSWTTATFSTTAAMIYNSTNGNRCVSIHDFGGTQTVSAGTFTVLMPTADQNNALLRIS